MKFKFVKGSEDIYIADPDTGLLISYIPDIYCEITESYNNKTGSYFGSTQYKKDLNILAYGDKLKDPGTLKPHKSDIYSSSIQLFSTPAVYIPTYATYSDILEARVDPITIYPFYAEKIKLYEIGKNVDDQQITDCIDAHWSENGEIKQAYFTLLHEEQFGSTAAWIVYHCTLNNTYYQLFKSKWR